jgi:hypothetical protein
MLQIFPDGVVYSHTLQSLPLVARRTASPRPLPSRRFSTLRPSRPQGFARSTNPLSCTGVATSRDPMLSWALIPFRVLPTRSACESHATWLTRTRTRTGPTIAGASRACVDLAQPTWNRDSGSNTLRLFESEVDFSSLFILHDDERRSRSDLPWAFLLHLFPREREDRHASRPFEDHTD